MTTTNELFERLSGDAWRISHPFSDDILQANALLHNTAATEQEMTECVQLWCANRQPCQFGRVAATEGRIHFCFLTEEAVSRWTDDEIAENVAEEKRLWKQRAAFDPKRVAHSLILIVASSRVALATPDQHLRAFSDRILELAGWEPDRRGVRRRNTVTSDFLYLRNPADGGFYGFQFNADFFACAGDGRWWHDHRFPGGIAFTANSTGHMIAFREWYQGKGDSHEWALKQAMVTVNNAQAVGGDSDSADPARRGKATWLRYLDESGQPLVSDVDCPLTTLPTSLQGKDWTRYEGVLHTDHAVRDEFFRDRETPPLTSKPYLMDFTYLFDTNQPDFVQFTGGKPFTTDDIFAEIGRPEGWEHREAEIAASRSESESRVVAEQLQACRGWEALYSASDSGY
ncbi:MAG: hypothetical protein RIC55_14120 [Pirellulaceae bacterium]